MPVSDKSDQTDKNSLVGERRPSHIVIFKRPSENNTEKMTKVLGVKSAQKSARSSCSILKTGSNHADGRMYHGLGVAVADLTPEQAHELAKSDEVLSVVPNMRRTIPRPIEDIGDSFVQSPAPPSFTGPINVTDPALAYLLGVRDAADLAARFLQQGGHAPSVVAGAAAFNGHALVDASHSWCLSLIGLNQNYSKATGAGVKVAVLDTGIDLNHPDFAGRFQEGNTAVSFVPGESVQDGNGHGTHCAGVVAGPANGGLGKRRYGVAPDAELIIGKVLNDEGTGSDDQILDAIDWAAHDMGATIISMSLGSDRGVGFPFSPEYEQIAEVLLEKGVLIFAAAGNESQRPFFTRPVGNPAACPSVWSVAAVDRKKQIASFSCRRMDNIGDIDVSGPGVAVYSSWTGGGYKTISGTSMATPHAAGTAALFSELNSDLSAKQLRNLIFGACLPLGSGNDFGRGLIQVP